MTALAIRGWCPGALRPMTSGDGLVLRLRPALGMLTRAQALGLADLAEAHGQGALQLTNRANIQLRGLRDADLVSVQQALATLGLVDLTIDPDAEARLNILVTPFWRAGGRWDVQALWSRLRKALLRPDAPRLPSKFGFAIDVREERDLADESADVRIETGGGGLIVRADGAARGSRAATAEDAVALAVALARWFVASGGVGPDGRGRMRDHLARGAAAPVGDVEPAASARCAPGELIGFDFGMVEAADLRRLAQRSRDALRLTPWRSLHLPDVTRLPADPAFIRDPGDPRLRRFACVGAPGCAQGAGDPRALARRLRLLPPPGATLHISGCAKGCAHPGAADRTLTFTGGGVGVIRNGRAGDRPEQVLSPDDLAGLAVEGAYAARL